MSAPVTELTALKIQSPIIQGQGGLQVAQMTTVQRDTLVEPIRGSIIYNTTTNQFEFYQNGTWITFTAPIPPAESAFEDGTFVDGNKNKIVVLTADGLKAKAGGLAEAEIPRPELLKGECPKKHFRNIVLNHFKVGLNVKN